MKIYNKIKLDIDSLEVLEEDSFDYSGPIFSCAGQTMSWGRNTVVDIITDAIDQKMSQEDQDLNSSGIYIKRSKVSKNIHSVLNLKFALNYIIPPVTSTSDIVSAVIYLKSDSSTQSGIDTTIYRLLRQFNETTNWEYRKPYHDKYWTNRIGGAILGDRENLVRRSTKDYDSTPSTVNVVDESDTWYEYDVTNIIKEVVSDGVNVGFVLRYPRSGGSSVFGIASFYGSDAVNADDRPYMSITFATPVASSSSSSVSSSSSSTSSSSSSLSSSSSSLSSSSSSSVSSSSLSSSSSSLSSSSRSSSSTSSSSSSLSSSSLSSSSTSSSSISSSSSSSATATCTLTRVETLALPALVTGYDAFVDSNQIIYVPTGTNARIRTYSIDNAGDLTYINQYLGRTPGTGQRTAAACGNLIIVSGGVDGIQSFSHDGAGHLTYLTYWDSLSDAAMDLWVAPDNVIYVAYRANGVRSFSVDQTTGVFTPIHGLDQGGNYLGIWGDTSKSILYCGCDASGLRTYSYAAGILTYRDTDDQGGNYYKVYGINGSYVFVACGPSGLRSYSTDAFGTLTYIDTDHQGGPGSSYLDVTGDGGDFVYVACYEEGLRCYTYDINGNLIFGSADDWASGQYEGIGYDSIGKTIVPTGDLFIQSYKNT